MNIAYKGKFLREGLLAAGHQIYDLDVNNGISLDAALKTAPFAIDFVFWEFFGAFSALRSFTQVDCPVAAWCIDAPINEFWFKHIARNADLVFVDQPQAIRSLAQCGIQAHWLPLPAPPSFFQPQRKKEFDLTFIGTIDANRIKRKNLVKLIKSKFNMQVLAGVPIHATQEIFSKSKVIINENFFPGLTLRILQGLSAGTVVFTEEFGDQGDYGLANGQDLVCYNSDNILSLLDETISNYQDYAQIGANGQKTCRNLFASEIVVERLTALLKAVAPGCRRLRAEDFAWNKITAEIPYIQRFGGKLGAQARLLKGFADSDSARKPEAMILQGDILAKSARTEEARRRYEQATRIDPGRRAHLKLALLAIGQGDLQSGQHWITQARRACPEIGRRISKAAPMPQDKCGLLACLADIYLGLGLAWDMGFFKSFPDPVPDTAFELARLAWQARPNAKALEIMDKCLEPHKMQGELLPYLLAGIRLGLLSDNQILETARLSHEYYDPATAATILGAMKKAR